MFVDLFVLVYIHPHNFHVVPQTRLPLNYCRTHFRTLLFSFPVGRASPAADWDSFAEQPPGADVSLELHYALSVLQLHYAALENVFYGTFLCDAKLDGTKELNANYLQKQACPSLPFMDRLFGCIIYMFLP